MYREKQKDKEYNFVIFQGGLGDILSSLPAVKYALDNHTHLIINFWTHDYAVEIIEKCFENYNNLKTLKLSNNKEYKENLLTRSPNGHKISNLSCHLTDHAFLTIIGGSVKDHHKNYIQMEPIDVSNFNLPEKYVVVTTGFTSNTREWMPESVNGVTEYILSKGYTPVYLGKSYTLSYGNIGITGNFKADYSKGISLIDKTTLLEAHSIMNGSAAVLGLDNGLIHLAGMGKAPIVAGFTTVDPQHRLPYRNDKLGDNCYVVTPTKEELACIHCQSNMTFADQTHCFTTCFYNDYKCIQLMTADKWIKELEKIL